MIVEHLVIVAWLVGPPLAVWWASRANARDMRKFERFVEAFLGRRVVEAGCTPGPPTRQAPAGVPPAPVGALSSREAEHSPSSASWLPSSPGTVPEATAVPGDLQVLQQVGADWEQPVGAP